MWKTIRGRGGQRLRKGWTGEGNKGKEWVLRMTGMRLTFWIVKSQVSRPRNVLSIIQNRQSLQRRRCFARHVSRWCSNSCLAVMQRRCSLRMLWFMTRVLQGNLQFQWTIAVGIEHAERERERERETMYTLYGNQCENHGQKVESERWHLTEINDTSLSSESGGQVQW